MITMNPWNTKHTPGAANRLLPWARLTLTVLWLPACNHVGVVGVSLENDHLSAPVGDTAATTVTVQNLGEGSLVFHEFLFTEDPILDTGPQFQVAPYVQDQEILPDESLEFTVTFAPLAVGTATMHLTVSTNGGTETVSVSGEGINNPPEVEITPAPPDTVCPGEVFTLEARVFDLEDAALLPALQTTLTSSLEGSLPDGTLDTNGAFEAEVSLHTEGTHTLTLEVTDTHGATGSDTVQVIVSATGETVADESACSAASSAH